MRAKLWLAGAAVAAAAGGAAQAQDVESAAVGLPVPASIEPVSAPAAVIEIAADADGDWTTPFGVGVVDLTDLEDMSGGTQVLVAISNHDLDAVNRDNTINADTVGSGDVNLGADAFSGFNGIGNFVINTGHNNNLQGSLSVNVVVGQ